MLSCIVSFYRKGPGIFFGRSFARPPATRPIHMHTDTSVGLSKEKREESRSPTLKHHRVEIKMVGEPIYQFKVSDVSTGGAGLLVSETSRFLKLIEVGQEYEVTFISPQGAEPVGMYKVEIRHITKTETGKYKGVRQVGIRILGKSDAD